MTKKTWRYKIRPIRIEGDVAYISLTQGKFAIIDVADIPLVEGWNWCAIRAESGLWYAYSAGKRKLRLHQVLLPPPSGMMTDHVDRNGLNCRRENLRFATALQNSHNRKRAGKSGFKGVTAHGRLWRARIVVDKKRQILGEWKNPRDAALAYDKAALKHFGEFAYLNFPEVTDAVVARMDREVG